MFVKSLSILLILGFSLAASASMEGKSARRDPKVSYEAYKMQAWFQSQQQNANQFVGKTAVDSAVSADKAETAQIQTWKNTAELQTRFEKIRDTRFLTTTDMPNFLRRSSWLFPDDGCFARAGLAIRNLAEWMVPVANKIFVFGNLVVKTDNSPDGEVTWWYHVAPIIEVGNQKYVLDPALNPKAPTKYYNWLAMMGDPKKMEVAICASGAYTPYSACSTETDGLEERAFSDQPGYLQDEWARLEQLRRDPVKELGDNPPWL